MLHLNNPGLFEFGDKPVETIGEAVAIEIQRIVGVAAQLNSSGANAQTPMLLIKYGGLECLGLYSVLKATRTKPISVAAENPVARRLR